MLSEPQLLSPSDNQALRPQQPLVARKRTSAAGSRARWSSRPLLRVFWVTFIGLIITVIVKSPDQPLGSAVGAMLIIAAAMYPSYLWASGRVRGLPLFPACALTFTWAFALPLIEDHPMVALFSNWDQFVAGLSVTGFLVIGTLTWYSIARLPPRPPAVCWGMHDAPHTLPLLGTLAMCALWTLAYTAGWIHLSSGLVSISYAVLIAVEALACFILSYQLGQRKLRGADKIIFFLLVGMLIVATLPSLILIMPMSLVAVTCMAYVVSSKLLPWRLGLLALCVFAFLHLGKAEMRERHWREDDSPAVAPAQYPAFFAEWVGMSIKAIRETKSNEDHGESLLTRSSLMHWLLFFQTNTPDPVPYLKGATYAVIPRMFVPRIFSPDKPMSSEAGDMIAVHYGIQTREGTETTHLAFGLLDEAYANFGFLGMAVLGGILGAIYGKISHWARGMPILSFRSLFAMLVASYCFQAEFTSTYYVAAIFQSTMVLILGGVIFMRPMRRQDPRVSLLD